MKNPEINLPKDVLGLCCEYCKNDLEEITNRIFVCKHCFAKVGIMK